MLHNYTPLAAALLFSFLTNLSTAQQVEFGKNRLQYRKKADQWVYFETANFVTYWFGDARNVAQSALQTAEYDFAELEALLEHPLSEKIEMIVYHDLTDLKTSNLGAGDDSDGARDGLGRSLYQLAYTGGQLADSDTKTRVIGGKIFVHFDGNHNHLRGQIREGMAGVMLNSMLFGANLQEIVQNAVLLNLPPWFTDGLLSYCADDWSPELDNQLRDVLASGKYKNFEKLSRAYPRLAGHAMWHYVGIHFGRQTVSNLLYLTRINRSVESGFLYVLGGTYKRNCDAMMVFFKKRYAEDAKNLDAPDPADELKFRNKKNLPTTQLRLSPDGKRMAFVTNDLGKWRVKIFDFEKEKMATLLKGSFRNAIQSTDFNYPLLAWSPNGQEISVVFEQRDVVKLRRFNLVTGEKLSDKLPPDFMRVYSISAISTENLLLSALVKGQSDLFIYKTKTRGTERLTNDFWDDLDATVFQQGEKRGILWASNRSSDTLETDKLDSILPLARFDIFYMPLNEAAVAPPATNSKPETRNSKLDIPRQPFMPPAGGIVESARAIVRVTNTPGADERRPIAVDSTFFSFLGDETGVMNLNSGQLEDFPAFHRQVFYKKNGEEVILEGQFSVEKNEWAVIERAWKKAPDADFGEIRTTKLKVDTTLKFPKKGELDSVRLVEIWKKRAITWNQTNFDRQVSDISVSQKSGKIAELIWRNGRYHIFTKKAEPRKNRGARLTYWRLNQQALMGILPAPGDSTAAVLTEFLTNELPPDSIKTELLPKSKIDPNWLFQTPFEDQPAEPTKVTVMPQVIDFEEVSASETGQPRITGPVRGRDYSPTGGGKVVRFNPSRIVPYRLKFRTESMKLTVDNSLLFEGLDSYAGTPTDKYRTPPVGILAKGVFNDLFEDYVLSGGVRVPTTFNGAEYFMVFDNKKRRLDRRAALYRKTQQFRDQSGSFPGSPAQLRRARLNTVLGQYEVRWPIDLFTSLRATATLRQDRSFDLTTDDYSLKKLPLTEQRAAVRVTAVFDNTIDIDLNLRTGSRAKIWAEAVKGVNINPEQRKFDLKNGYMTVIGLDARHYQRLDRRSIFAMRLAAGTSFGSERVLYFLGGTDQAFFPRFNDRIPLPTGDDFAFQTAATNLRGFKLNIRNGNSFALLNNELRVPIFKYLSSKPTMAAFWRNFQLTGFFDVGTAWQGKNPYNATNPINTTYLENPPTVFIKVNYFRDPLVAGYGFGARTTLFGFFLRVDHGWGIETRKVQDAMWHFSMGTDF